MAIDVTPRAIEVLRRAFELGRMDPGEIAVRVTLSRGPRGDEARTAFADALEPDEVSIERSGLRLYVPRELEERGATIDVSDEHDTIVVR